MARYKAMASSEAVDQAPPPLPATKTAPLKSGPVLAPLTAGIDPVRYARLCAVVIRVDPRFAEPAVISAARLWCRTPAGPASTDRTSIALVARYLALEAERIGGFNAPAALRRSNVDRYLHDRALRRTARSMHTVKGVLYTAARIVLPHEYPKPGSVNAPRIKRIPAASPKEIRNWYALAPTLPPSLALRLQILLDLCYGAGARAPDFKVLRGSSITAMQTEGYPIAVVRLPNQAGGTRSVPVADPAISARLLTLARESRSEYLMPATCGVVERNAVNRISEHLRHHGHRSVNAAALRNRWVLDLAARVPAVLMLQLADVVDVQVLADQRRLLPKFTLEQAATLVKDTRR